MKKILVLNFFPAFYPPQSGGELRYYNMYRNLSEQFDITLLSPTYRDRKMEIIVHTTNFREYRVPKEEIHDTLHMDIEKEKICSEISALVCCLSSKYYNQYHVMYQKLYSDSDIIIHEFPYMLDYDMFFGIDNKLRIYNSHNFESNLVSQMWSGPNAEKYLSIIRKHEARLVRECDLVFATSQEEQLDFVSSFGANGSYIHVAPNGIDVSLYEGLRQSRRINRRKKAFFIGSAHPPNMEAVDFIMNAVAPQCENVDFYIAGKCCNGVASARPNVFLLGLINDAKKEELFSTSDIAINPMFSGAGTNLKTLEFLSAGIPMISTNTGVRGLELEDGKHFIHAEKENFCDKLLEFLNKESELQSIADKGKEFVNATYSWKGICGRVSLAIDEALQRNRAKRLPVIFAINDYEANKPVAGGSVRIYNLFSQLAQTYQVVYFCLNNTANVKVDLIVPNFLHVSLPKTAQHLAEENRVNSKHWISANDIVAGYMIRNNEYVMNTVKNAYQLSSLIILSHPYMVYTLDNLDGKPTIYESHNFEYELKKGMLCQHSLKDQLVYETEKQEKQALAKCNLVISVSQEEVQDIQNFSLRSNLQISVVRNGVNIVEPQYDYTALKKSVGDRPILVFVGSGHSPNVGAVNFIIGQLANELPNCIFAIIGSVCGAFKQEDVPDNVLLFGVLSEEHKNFILFSSTIALNPIQEGAGSNLKLAEYFSFLIPTITTSFGARGYAIENHVEAIICECRDFAQEIQKILNHTVDVKSMTKAAFLYVQRELCWSTLGEQYKLIIEKLLQKKRALLVTYRYNNHPRGGAEVYVSNTLTKIAKRGNYLLDVATTNIGDIVEKFRFSCEYTKDDNIDVEAVPNFRCFKFSVEGIDESIQWKKCRTLYNQFMMESRTIAESFLEKYKYPILMGGWHYPENSSEGMKVWSSGNSEIFIDRVKSFKISGYSPKRIELSLFVDGKIVKKEKVSGSFTVLLGNLSGKILTLKSDEFYVENKDPRPLSINILELSYQIGDENGFIDFNDDYKAILKRICPDEYINTLIRIAKQRDNELNADFYNCRGPISYKLEEWLDNNIKNYDVVIGHSVPFGTSILADKYARKYKVPIVQLPHFHIEDDFYHWNGYYDMLISANRVIAAPKAAIPLFYNKLHAKTTFIQGGGIERGEFDNISTTEFDRQYTSDIPFILVLGRKAGAKNYKWVIEAVSKINRNGVKVRLVIIGRDDDKYKVDVPNVTYLGEQSRNSVLGALKRCSFVVNMSGSESFGIVILEAWLAGKTIIVNESCAAFTELVDDGVNGIYAEESNLVEKIVGLLESGNEAKLAKAGMEKAQEEFTWENISRNIETILCDL